MGTEKIEDEVLEKVSGGWGVVIHDEKTDIYFTSLAERNFFAEHQEEVFSDLEKIDGSIDRLFYIAKYLEKNGYKMAGCIFSCSDSVKNEIIKKMISSN